VSAKDKKTGATQTQQVTVTVVPPPDTVTAAVTYVTGTTTGGKTRLQVSVTTNAQLVADPNTFSLLSPTLTLSFVVSDPNDPRFGQTVIWNSFALVLNVPTATVLGFPIPDSVTITSSAGGSVTVPQAAFTIR